MHKYHYNYHAFYAQNREIGGFARTKQGRISTDETNYQTLIFYIKSTPVGIFSKLYKLYTTPSTEAIGNPNKQYAEIIPQVIKTVRNTTFKKNLTI